MKWLLAIPHNIVLAFLGIAALVAVIGAWFAVLLTGHYPRGIFDFIEGVLRWALRVQAYAFRSSPTATHRSRWPDRQPQMGR